MLPVLCRSEHQLHVSARAIDVRHDPMRQDDLAFTLDALNQVKPNERQSRYQTVKLSTSRATDYGDIDVDVFEMRWADLSSGPRLLHRFLGELYQVLFHLASLGRKTVITAWKRASTPQHGDAANRTGGGPARLLYLAALVHRALACFLPTAIPVANLYFMMPVIMLSVLLLPQEAISPLAIIVLLVLVYLAALTAAYLTGLRFGGVAAAALVVGTGIWIVPHAAAFPADWPNVALGYAAMLAGFLGATLGCHAILQRYGEAVQTWGTWLAAAVVASLLAYAFVSAAGIASPAGVPGLLQVAMTMAHYLFYVLQWLWLAAFFLIAVACVLPAAAAVAGLPADHREALRTGRIGALVSAVLFFIATAMLWAAILALLRSPIAAYPEVSFSPALKLLYQDGHLNCSGLAGGTSITLAAYADCLFVLTTGANANIFLMLAGVALLLAASCVLPSAWFERYPPTPAQARSAPAYERLWQWLNDGRHILRLAEIVLIAAGLSLAAGYPGTTCEGPADDSWIGLAGGVLAATLPSLLLLRNHLPSVLSVALDIVLDVSNWLKERPLERNPRGLILWRYIRLLRELATHGRYDRIIIVAHSQGSVISADLFRLLEQLSLWQTLVGAHPEIVLVSAGSPLRQLYAARFPHWYEWADRPQRVCLGIAGWINFFRTGDYVGRALWEDDPDPKEVERIEFPVDSMDISLGVGAHTHYFDSTAPAVATVIDKLVVAPRSPRTPPAYARREVVSGGPVGPG
jgi:hypothetical protein